MKDNNVVAFYCSNCNETVLNCEHNFEQLHEKGLCVECLKKQNKLKMQELGGEMRFEIRLITNQNIKGNINKITDVEIIDDFVRVKFDDGATYYYAKRLVEAIYIE